MAIVHKFFSASPQALVCPPSCKGNAIICIQSPLLCQDHRTAAILILWAFTICKGRKSLCLAAWGAKHTRSRKWFCFSQGAPDPVLELPCFHRTGFPTLLHSGRASLTSLPFELKGTRSPRMGSSHPICKFILRLQVAASPFYPLEFPLL